MKIVIIDYNAGNVRSVLFALERIGVTAELTSDLEKIKAADKVIFPGVGEAKNTMAYLRKTGLADTICNLKQPTLGICLGMQLLCEHSEEGNTDCLNIIPLKVKKFLATLFQRLILLTVNVFALRKVITTKKKCITNIHSK